MSQPSPPGPDVRVDHRAEPPLSLRDIVEAICSGMGPNTNALELALDRIEGTRQ